MGDISKRGLDFIKRKEGYYSKAYLCPAGVWTIGWGSIRWSATRPVQKGDTCTEEQAEKLILREVQRVEDAVDATIRVPLTQGQYDCLISVFYNIGIGWLTGKGHQQATFVKLLNKGQYDRIPSELLKFSRANGKVIKGLRIRREEEVRELWLADYESSPSLAETPAAAVITDPEVEPMPQAVEPSKVPLTEGAAKSPTIWSSLVGLISTAAGAIWQLGGTVATETTAEVGAAKQSLGGFEALWSALGISLQSVLAVVTIGALGVVLIRHVQRYAEGRA